jgi:hypothetical protein
MNERLNVLNIETIIGNKKDRVEISDETLGILDLAICCFGEDSQLLMAVEEMSELQKEICKKFRYDKDTSSPELVDEVADVLITVYQVARMCGVEAVNERISYKIGRLK